MKCRVALLIGILAGSASPAPAYSVLAHESNVDALWDSAIRPILARRFPRATAEELRTARAYCYGGSVIQDLGYYPFGSHFFSNLVHYVRSGDFVETMVRDAESLDEYAFAIGALAHYAADNTGHPEAVNRAVALMFPKLRARYGDSVTYVQSPAAHVLVEFSFDVVQVASGGYESDAYHRFIGFRVSKPLLERAFRDTYGLELSDVFTFDEDLAIGTYRRSVSETLPALTEVAWRDHREEIERITPGMEQSRFLFRFSRQDYDEEYGTDYRRPGFWSRVLAAIYKIVPKVGPLRPLKFETPTTDAEVLFQESLKDTRTRLRRALESVERKRLDLPNTNFDTGRVSVHGEYELADETHAELVKRLAKTEFRTASAALRQNISRYYAAAPDRVSSRKERQRTAAIRQSLDAMRRLP